MGVLSWGTENHRALSGTGRQWVAVVRSGGRADVLGFGLRASFMPSQAAAIKCLYGIILSSLGNKITFLLRSPFILALFIFDLIRKT